MNTKKWTIICNKCGKIKIYSTYSGYYEAKRLGRIFCRSCAIKKRWENSKERSKYDRLIKQGQRFGKLVVLSKKIERGNQVLCKCECGNLLKKRAIRLLTENNNGCQKCLIGELNHLWKGVGKVPKIALTRIKHHAIRTHKEFNITLKYLSEIFDKQRGKCALSGMNLNFGVSNIIEQTASLDRIDSLKGYIKGNVQWVHKNVNWMKQDFSEDEFLSLCKKIVEYRKI
ncbi:MAG TPA: hypothetical protein PKX15_00750 [Bacteroidales bacterium]|nr:hypothetical protein [Bacteroidales bacterium]